MPFLSPAKLLVVLVIALVVLGPDKLPKLARQVGSLWGDLQTMRQQLESGVRDAFPDLPTTERMTQVVRSPMTFLDGLADTPAPAEAGEASTAAAAPMPADTGDPFRSAVDYVRSAGTLGTHGTPCASGADAGPAEDVVTELDPRAGTHRLRAPVGVGRDAADPN